MSFRIGPIEIKSPVVLAPMAGVTDLAFRLVVRSFHEGLSCAEMVSSQSLVHAKSRKKYLLRFDPRDTPTSVQILGRDASLMAEAAKILEDMGAQAIDINMGCSVRKVLKQREGSALLREPEVAGAVMKAVVKAVTLPVTLKMRMGFSEDPKRALLFSKIAEDSGIAALAVHGRTIEQGFSGKADWEIVAQVKNTVAVTVIGNGDVKTPPDAATRMRESGCDAVMIGRGAMGNPWLLRNAARACLGLAHEEPATEEKFPVMLRHIALARELAGESSASKTIRKHLVWYLKGMPLASRMRDLIFHQNSCNGLVALIEKYRDYISGLNGRPEAEIPHPRELAERFESSMGVNA
ncbi:MAG: tRNA dihydrouridine synthase DusB [Candidatus Eremiobacteraeota bacterium]|nr:tRNA dihydrouridine synthase DusB [Candidatus Eremiobacteraeota bacterium]